ncbi:hypothetical protein V5O48_011498 [Marasmius crinis-equi]|uniref:Uncharacterized protein n=1 Tax=Marasmius crinis-equi TaxID=585013 RepID=A0ABR3F5C4_9AGAR
MPSDLYLPVPIFTSWHQLPEGSSKIQIENALRSLVTADKSASRSSRSSSRSSQCVVDDWLANWTEILCNSLAIVEVQKWFTTSCHIPHDDLKEIPVIDLARYFLLLMAKAEGEGEKEAQGSLNFVQIQLARKLGSPRIQRNIAAESAREVDMIIGADDSSDEEDEEDLGEESPLSSAPLSPKAKIGSDASGETPMDISDSDSEEVPMDISDSDSDPVERAASISMTATPMAVDADSGWISRFQSWAETLDHIFMVPFKLPPSAPEEGEIIQETFGQSGQNEKGQILADDDVFNGEFVKRQIAFVECLRAMRKVTHTKRRAESREPEFRVALRKTNLPWTIVRITEPGFLAKHAHPHNVKLARMYGFVDSIGDVFDRWVFEDEVYNDVKIRELERASFTQRFHRSQPVPREFPFNQAPSPPPVLRAMKTGEDFLNALRQHPSLIPNGTDPLGLLFMFNRVIFEDEWYRWIAPHLEALGFDVRESPSLPPLRIRSEPGSSQIQMTIVNDPQAISSPSSPSLPLKIYRSLGRHLATLASKANTQQIDHQVTTQADNPEDSPEDTLYDNTDYNAVNNTLVGNSKEGTQDTRSVANSMPPGLTHLLHRTQQLRADQKNLNKKLHSSERKYSGEPQSTHWNGDRILAGSCPKCADETDLAKKCFQYIYVRKNPDTAKMASFKGHGISKVPPDQQMKPIIPKSKSKAKGKGGERGKIKEILSFDEVCKDVPMKWISPDEAVLKRCGKMTFFFCDAGTKKKLHFVTYGAFPPEELERMVRHSRNTWRVPPVRRGKQFKRWTSGVMESYGKRVASGGRPGDGYVYYSNSDKDENLDDFESTGVVFDIAYDSMVVLDTSEVYHKDLVAELKEKGDACGMKAIAGVNIYRCTNYTAPLHCDQDAAPSLCCQLEKRGTKEEWGEYGFCSLEYGYAFETRENTLWSFDASTVHGTMLPSQDTLDKTKQVLRLRGGAGEAEAGEAAPVAISTGDHMTVRKRDNVRAWRLRQVRANWQKRDKEWGQNTTELDS